jgi:hypothetical protein
MNQKIQYRYYGLSLEHSCVLPFFSVIKLREPQALYPSFERFFILGGPREFREKKFKIRTRYESAARNENHGSVILCVAVNV